MPSNDYQRSVSNEQRKRRIKRIILETSISALLIISAIILSICLKQIIPKKILAAVKLEPGSDGFKNWLNPPISTTRSYYLFNITNPIDIVMDPKSTIIKFKDTPPYAYNIKTSKTNVEWLNNNTEISYAVERIFTRDPNRFNPSSVNDTGIFVDLLRASFRTQFGPISSQPFYDLGGTNAFDRRNVVEQLEGFTSPLFNSMQDKMIGPNIDKSGLIYRQNGSRLYNVSIQTDLMKKGEILTFDSELVRFNILSPSYYSFPIYDGLTYPPMLFDKPTFNIFNSDFCRPMLLEYKRSIKKYGLIKMHEYKVKLIDYNNCTNSSDIRTCFEVDKLDISKCISESLPNNTIFLSKPHFYGSSNETIQKMNIEGFIPNSDKHDSVICFEPYSGTPFKANLRIQLNVDAMIDPMKYSEYGSGLEPTRKKNVKRLVPIFWLDQTIDLSLKFKFKLGLFVIILDYGIYIFILLSIVLAIITIFIIEILDRRASKNGQYIRGAYIKSEPLVQY